MCKIPCPAVIALEVTGGSIRPAELGLGPKTTTPPDRDARQTSILVNWDKSNDYGPTLGIAGIRYLLLLNLLGPESPQSLLQRIFLFGCRLGWLSDWINLARRCRVEFLAQLQPSIVGQLAQQFLHGVIADLHAGAACHGILVDAVAHGVFLVLHLVLLERHERLLGVHVALCPVHRLGGLSHHVGHAVHGVVCLDLSDAEFGHVGCLVHLRGDRLLGEEHAGFLRGLGGFALFEELLTSNHVSFCYSQS